ncbi:MAG: hypothetical protein JJT94_07730 [Bernardetiaceae bacterium]|nr:hypothetical protein [Bernardetiaceae bacterium]
MTTTTTIVYKIVQEQTEREATYRISKAEGIEDLWLLELIGKMEFEFYKKMWIHMLEISKKENSRNLIIDTSLLTYSAPKARAWFITSYVSRVHKALPGLRAVVVKSRSRIQDMMIQVLLKSARSLNLSIELYTVGTREEAEDFFIQNPTSDRE